MHDYQLTVPHEFEAFHLGIRLMLIQFEPAPEFESSETKDATVFLIQFEDEDQMYSFHKQINESMPYLFK